VLDLTGGELFVVVFITIAVISAPWWPRLGELVAEQLAGTRRAPRDSHAPLGPGEGPEK
jgi:hypothetical protein